jgi:hypothetical protein
MKPKSVKNTLAGKLAFFDGFLYSIKKISANESHFFSDQYMIEGLRSFLEMQYLLIYFPKKPKSSYG